MPDIFDTLRGRRNRRPNTGTLDHWQSMVSMWQWRLEGMVRSRYRWETDLFDGAWAEEYLYAGTLMCGWRPDYIDRPVLSPASVAATDRWGRPATYTVEIEPWGQRFLPAEECIPLWTSLARRAPVLDVAIYADRLAHMDLSLDQRIIASRRPVLIAGDESQQLSLAKMWHQIQLGAPTIMTYSAFGQHARDAVQAIDMGVPLSDIEPLQGAKRELWREALSSLGVIRLPQTDKRERLVSAEAESSDDETMLARTIWGQPRLDFCRQMAEKYGENISVKWVGMEVEDATSNNDDSRSQ